MAITDSQKVDLLYKKVGFGVSKTDTSTYKSPSNEGNASPQLTRGDTIWQQADQVPAIIPTSNSSAVVLYNNTVSSTIECVPDTTSHPTSSVYPTWLTNLQDWIPPSFGSTYQVKVYAAPAGNSAPQTYGTQLFADGSGNSDSWYFDYQAGVLNFLDTNIPTALTSAYRIYIMGARYVGPKGITTWTGNITVGNLTFGGNTIGSTGGNIILNSNVIITGNTTFSGYTDLTIQDSVINLHTQANLAPWTYNDGKDIGFKFHYYDTQDSHAGLVRANDSGFLEWYARGSEGSGNTFVGSAYGTIKAGEMYLSNATPSISSTTGALRVTGGVGIGGNANIAGNVSANTAVFSDIYGNVHGTVPTANVAYFANITATTNDQTYYLLLADKTSGNSGIYSENTVTVDPGTGNVSASNLIGNFYGPVITAYQPYITTVGTLTNLTVSGTTIANVITANAELLTGNLTANNAVANVFYGNIVGNVTGNVTGTILTNTQPYITTVGTLGNLTVNANITTGNILSSAYFYANGTPFNYGNVQVAAYLPTYTGNLSANAVIANFYGNINVDQIGSYQTGNIVITPGNNGIVTINSSTALGLPFGSNVARPNSTRAGLLRYNSDIGTLEYFNGSAWIGVTNTITDQLIVPDGVTNTFTLNATTTSAGVLVSINGTLQQPDLAYTVNGTQLVFTEVPGVYDIISVRFIATAVSVTYDALRVDTTPVLVTTANTIVDSFDSTVYRSAKYTISSNNGTDQHMAEIMLLQGNGNALVNTYSVLNTGSNTINYYANILGSTVNLLANGTTGSNQLRIQKTYFNI
jgi:hypothetical protein